MGISSRSDSPPVHARRVGQAHELATVPEMYPVLLQVNFHRSIIELLKHGE